MQPSIAGDSCWLEEFGQLQRVPMGKGPGTHGAFLYWSIRHSKKMGSLEEEMGKRGLNIRGERVLGLGSN